VATRRGSLQALPRLNLGWSGGRVRVPAILAASALKRNNGL